MGCWLIRAWESPGPGRWVAPNIRCGVRTAWRMGEAFITIYGPEGETLAEYRGDSPLTWANTDHRREFVIEVDRDPYLP